MTLSLRCDPRNFSDEQIADVFLWIRELPEYKHTLSSRED